MKENIFSDDEIFLFKAIVSGLKFPGIQQEKQRLWRLINEYNIFNPPYLCSRNLNLPVFSPEQSQQLESLYLQSSSRYYFQKRHTVEIIRTLEESYIAAIPLKGVFLNELIYGNAVMRRTSWDIDILVKREDYRRVKDILYKQGYQSSDVHYVGEGINMQAHFVNSEGSIIDLGFKFTTNYRMPDISESEYWQRTSSVKVRDVTLKTLSKEMTFIYLCVLIIKDNRLDFIRPLHLLDMHFFLMRYKDNLDYRCIGDIIRKNLFNVYVLNVLNMLEDISGCRYGLDRNFLKRIHISTWRKNVVLFALLKLRNKNNNHGLKYIFLCNIAYSYGYLSCAVSWLMRTLKCQHVTYLKENNLGNNYMSWLRHLLRFIFNFIKENSSFS